MLVGAALVGTAASQLMSEATLGIRVMAHGSFV
jgi:hypothetical protein